MNKTHRSLWNAALGAWVAAPENARPRGKCGGGIREAALTVALLAAGSPLAMAACSASDGAGLAACMAGSESVINLTNNITLNAHLAVIERNLIINGNGYALDGAGAFRGLFIGAGTTTVNGLTMQNLLAKGGSGGTFSIPGG
ncbi:ESPR domain-containing protein, partial [Variovorax sp. KK3]